MSTGGPWDAHGYQGGWPRDLPNGFRFRPAYDDRLPPDMPTGRYRVRWFDLGESGEIVVHHVSAADYDPCDPYSPADLALWLADLDATVILKTATVTSDATIDFTADDCELAIEPEPAGGGIDRSPNPIWRNPAATGLPAVPRDTDPSFGAARWLP